MVVNGLPDEDTEGYARTVSSMGLDSKSITEIVFNTGLEVQIYVGGPKRAATELVGTIKRFFDLHNVSTQACVTYFRVETPQETPDEH